MRKRGIIKKAIAMVAMIATVLDSSAITTLASEVRDDTPIVVEDLTEEYGETNDDITIEVVKDEPEEALEESYEEVSDENDSADESIDENADEFTENDEFTESDEDFSEDNDEFTEENGEVVEDSEDFDDVSEDEFAESDEFVTEELPEEEEVPKELSVNGSEIYGSGYTDFVLDIDASSLKKGQFFGVKIDTDADVNVEGEGISDGYISNLNYETTTLLFSNLDKKSFTIYFVGETVDSIYSDFVVKSVENGAVLATVSTDFEEEETSLSASENGISGEGYDTLSLGMEYLASNSDEEDLEETSFSYDLYIDTQSEVTVNGEGLADGKVTLDSSVSEVSVEGLEGEHFDIYAQAIIEEENFKCDITYSVASAEDGTAGVVFSYGSEDVKREYTYEDSKVKVVAVLEKADAIPDDAYFAVTPVTDTDKYLDVMNESLDGETVYNDYNTLVYDISFFKDESMTEEIEPEEGSVSVSIEFKDNQIREDLGVDNDNDITVTHFEEDNRSIEAVVLDAAVDTYDETVEFTVDSFSKYAISGRVPVVAGTSTSYIDALGVAANYGIVANEMTLAGHLESNFATGALHGNADIQSCKNDGNGAGRTYIGSYDGSNFKMDLNNNKGSLEIVTTEDALRNFGFNMTHLQNKWDSLNNLQPPTGVVFDYTSKSETEIKSLVSGMIETVKNKSDSLMKESNSFEYKSLKNSAGEVDLTKYNAGTYYISFDTSSSTVGKSENKFPLNYTIRINSNQNVVLNIPDEKVEFGQYTLYIDGVKYVPQGNSNEEILFEKMIFNCPNAKKAKTVGAVTGTFLLPRATFTNGSVAAGFLVANVIDSIGSQEWHCISKRIDIVEDDETSLAIDVTKHLLGSDDLEVPDDKWPGEFKFKISKYTCSDPGDQNDGWVERNAKNIPDLDRWEVTIGKDTPGHKATFGKLTFSGEEVYKDSRSHVSGTYENTKFRVFMYKIEEVDNHLKDVIYDNVKPVYVKVFVNSKQITDNHVTKYFVWTEVKVSRTVFAGDCGPGFPEFNNHLEDKGSLRVNKVVTNAAASDNNTFYFVVEKNSKGSKNYVKNGNSNVWSVTGNDSVGTLISDLDFGTYYVTEVADANGNALNSDFGYLVSYSNSNGISINSSNEVSTTITNEKKNAGSLEIIKKDGTGNSAKALAGATFKVTTLKNGRTIDVYADGSDGVYSYVSATSSQTGYSTEMVTDSNGKIVLTGLPWGTYKVVETAAPTGYVNSGYSQEFTVGLKQSNNTYKTDYSFAVSNEKRKINLKLIKVDKDNNETKLSGVGFDIYVKDASGKTVKTYSETTDKDGAINISDLPWEEGYKYYYKETDSLKEYVPLSGEFDIFEIDNNTIKITDAQVTAMSSEGKTDTVVTTVGNEKYKGGLLIYKVGQKEGNAAPVALEGIGFTISGKSPLNAKLVNGQKTVDVDGTSVTVDNYYVYDTSASVPDYKTDANGYIYIEGVPAGTYTVLEQNENPVGYIADRSTHTLLVENKGVKLATFVNTTINANVKFYKQDSNNGANIAGAGFDLYEKLEGASSYTNRGTIYSGADGSITIPGVSIGEYFLVEVSAPENYKFSSDVAYCFTIDRNYKEGDAVSLTAKSFANGVPGSALGDDAAAKVLKNNNTILNTNNGSVELTKVAKRGSVSNLLGGVRFELYKVDGSNETLVKNGDVDYFTTGISTSADDEALFGKLKITGLVSGSYYLKEVGGEYAVIEKTADGYINAKISDYTIDTAKHSFTIDGNTNKSVKLSTVENKATEVYLKLVKKDAVTHEIIDFEQADFYFAFDLYRTVNGKDEQIKSDIHTVKGVIDASVIGKLEYSDAYTYYFKETKAGEGYVLPSGVAANTVIDNEQLKSHTSISDPYVISIEDARSGNGKVKLIKTNTNGEPLSGAHFDLYSSNEAGLWDKFINFITGKDNVKYGRMKKDLVTDVNGEITVTDLPWGEYFFVETQAPKDYEINAEKVAFRVGAGKDVNADGTVIGNSALDITRTLVDSDAKGKVKLTKKDAISNKKIEPKDNGLNYTAAFNLYQKDSLTGKWNAIEDVNTGLAKTYSTVSGELEVTGLQNGEYYFVEIAGPDGYKFNPNIKYSFTIADEDYATVTASAEVAGMKENNSVYDERLDADITLHKVENIGGDDVDLAGVEFYLLRNDGLFGGGWKYVDMKTTGTDGKVDFTDVAWGEYKVVEVPKTGYGMYDAEGNFLDTTDYTFKHGDISEKISGYLIKANGKETFEIDETLYNATTKTLTYDLGLVENEKKTTGVRVIKKGEDGKNLEYDKLGGQYPKFALYSEAGELLEEIEITSGEGAGFDYDLIWGDTYYIVETQAPFGHAVTANEVSDPFSCVTTESGQIRYYFTAETTDELSITLTNDKLRGNIHIVKTDDKSVKLDSSKITEQPKFVLYSDSECTKPVNLTGSNGAFTFAEAAADGITFTEFSTSDFEATIEGLPVDYENAPTKYYLKETYVPHGFSNKNLQVIEIEVNKNETTDRNVINSDFSAYVEFVKVDADNNNELLSQEEYSKITFTLYKDDANNYGTVINSTSPDATNGHVKFSNLPEGSYCVTESLDADSSYVNSGKQTYYFEINRDTYEPGNVKLTNADGTTADGFSFVSNKHKPGKVKVTKYDGNDDSAILAGAEFTLYKEGDESFAKSLVLSDGVWSADNLEWSVGGTTYYIVETKTPDGYKAYKDMTAAEKTELAKAASDKGFTLEEIEIGNETMAAFYFTLVAGKVADALEIRVPNFEEKGSVELEKVDGTGEVSPINITKLRAARFVLVNKKTNNSTQLVLDESTSRFKLDNIDWGTYALVETAAPTGYLLNVNYNDHGVKGTLVRDDVVIGKSGGTVKLYYYLTTDAMTNHANTKYAVNENAFSNSRNGKLLLKKIDKNNSLAVLSGITFNLYNEANELIASQNTEDRVTFGGKEYMGATVFNNLELGNYYLVELIPKNSDGSYMPYKYDSETSGVRTRRYPAEGYISITESDNGYAEYTAENEQLRGGILIKKVDKAHKPILPAESLESAKKEAYKATFELYAEEPVYNMLAEKTMAVLSGEPKLYRIAGPSETEFTDNANRVLFDDLPLGTYFVKETKAPIGYEKDETLKQVVLAEDESGNPVVTYEFEDVAKKVNVTLKKVDQAGAELDDAVFALYERSGNESKLVKDQITLNKDNQATQTIEGLDFGKTYYFVETSTPYAYAGAAISSRSTITGAEVVNDGNNDCYQFTLTPENGGATLMLEAVNTLQLGNIAIQKVVKDGDDTAVEVKKEGIEFKLTAKNAVNNFNDGKIVTLNIVTNEDGIATTEGNTAFPNGIPYGEYILEEISVPKDFEYPVRSDKITVNVPNRKDSESPEEAYDFENYKEDEVFAKVKITKVDSTDNKPIEGIRFIIQRKVNGLYQTVADMTTNEKGIAEVENALATGFYQVMEDTDTAKARGYIPSSAQYFFEITSADGVDATGNYKYMQLFTDSALNTPLEGNKLANDRQKGSLVIHKESASVSGADMHGAEFEVYGPDGNIVVSENGEKAVLTTKFNGDTEVLKDLEWGVYTYKETKPPKGYVLDDTIHEVTIGNDLAQLYYSLNDKMILDAVETVADVPFIEISKRILGATTNLAGGELTVSDGSNSVKLDTADTAEFTLVKEADEESLAEHKLLIGREYTLSETKVPAGYMKAKDVKYTVSETGVLTTTTKNSEEAEVLVEDDVQVLVMYDVPIVQVSKQDLGTKEYLAGATLALLHNDSVMRTNTDGSMEFVTTDKVVDLPYDLTVGEEYTLRELKAPFGYYKADDVTFTINSNGSVVIGGKESGNVVRMYDTPFTVLLKKVRKNSEKEEGSADVDYVAGATLKLLNDNNGATVWVTNPDNTDFGETFVTAGKPIRLVPTVSKAIPDKTVVDTFASKYPNEDVRFAYALDANSETGYSIYELDVAQGYIRPSASAKIGEFKLPAKDKNDKIIATASVTVYDDELRILVDKIDLNGEEGELISGAQLVLKDAANNEEIARWTTEGKTTLLISIPETNLTTVEREAYKNYQIISDVKLVQGHSYVIEEANDGVPVGYALAKSETVTLDDTYLANKNVLNPVPHKMEDPRLSVKVAKKDADGGYLKGATLQVLDENGIAVSDEFVSLATGPMTLKVGERANSYDDVIYVDKLERNKTYKLVETVVPDGYKTPEEYADNLGRTLDKTPGVTKVGDKYLFYTDIDITDSCVEGTAPEYALDNAPQDTTELRVNKSWTVPKNVKKPAVKVTLYKGLTTESGTVEYTEVETKKMVNDTVNFVGLTKFEGGKKCQYAIVETMADYEGAKASNFKWADATEKIYVKELKDYVDAKVVTNIFGANAENDADVEDIVNESIAKTSLSIGKTWLEYEGQLYDDMISADAVFYLNCNGERVKVEDHPDYVVYLGEDVVEQKGDYLCASVKNGSNVNVEFANLDSYDNKVNASGEYYKNEYTLEEVLVFDGKEYPAQKATDGYEFTILYNDYSYTYTMTMSVNADDEEKKYVELVNEPIYDPFEIHGKKLWIDSYATTTGKRPVIEIQLYGDGKFIDSTILGEDGVFSFTGLLERDVMGDWHKIDYELREVEITTEGDRVDLDSYEITDATFNGKKIDTKDLSGYAFSVDYNGNIQIESDGKRVVNTTFTNEEFVTVEGTKTWNDYKYYTERPSITIDLLADGTKINSIELTNRQTKYSFSVDEDGNRLPKFAKDGHEIVYTVEEEEVDGYVAKYNGTKITNTSTKVRISKIDATNSAELQGAVLALYDSKNKEVERWTSGTTSHVVEGLTAGAKYTLRELSVPEGYDKAADITFTVNTNGVEQKIVMKDERIFGDVTLYKRDADTRALLAGAVFNLYTAEGNMIATAGGSGSYEYYGGRGITNLDVSSSGTLTVTGLPYGTYYFVEASAPQGYQANTERIYFSITSQGAKEEVTCLDEKKLGSVRLTKIAPDGRPLAGAVFELYAATPRTAGAAVASTLVRDAYYYYGSFTTDASGRIEVSGLPWDDYYFIEVEAPAGYNLSRDVNGDPIVYTFSVNSLTAEYVVIDMGLVVNEPTPSPTPTPTPTITPTPTPIYTPTPTPAPEVRGERLERGVVSGVLGVRAKPTSGVLGERVGPVTGDAGNIVLWSLLLAACVATIVVLLLTGKKKKKTA